MSKRPRRKFETGFKKQLVAQIETSQITATEAARVHSISPTVISYWRKQFQAGELSEGPTRLFFLILDQFWKKGGGNAFVLAPSKWIKKTQAGQKNLIKLIIFIKTYEKC